MNHYARKLWLLLPCIIKWIIRFSISKFKNCSNSQRKIFTYKCIWRCCAKDNTQYRTWVAWCDTTEYPVSFPRHLEELRFEENVCLVSRRGEIFPRRVICACRRILGPIYSKPSWSEALIPWAALVTTTTSPPSGVVSYQS